MKMDDSDLLNNYTNSQIDVNGVKITLNQDQLKQIAEQTTGKKEKDIHDNMFNLCKEMVMKRTGETEYTYYISKEYWIFKYNYKLRQLEFNYFVIYNNFISIFNIDVVKVKHILKDWLEKNLKLDISYTDL